LGLDWKEFTPFKFNPIKPKNQGFRKGIIKEGFIKPFLSLGGVVGLTPLGFNWIRNYF